MYGGDIIATACKQVTKCLLMVYRCHAVCLDAQPEPAIYSRNDDQLIGHPVLLPLPPGAARGGSEANKALVEACARPEGC